MKWLEQSDAAAFSAFYINALLQWGWRQTILELKFPSAAGELAFSLSSESSWDVSGSFFLPFLFTLLSQNVICTDSSFIRVL